VARRPAGEVILHVANAKTYYEAPSRRLFGGGRQYVKAVDDVSITARRGYTLAPREPFPKILISPVFVNSFSINGRVLDGIGFLPKGNSTPSLLYGLSEKVGEAPLPNLQFS